MKQVKCLTCSTILGLIIEEPYRDEFIELYREFLVCVNGHNNKIVEEYSGDPEIETPFYQADF